MLWAFALRSTSSSIVLDHEQLEPAVARSASADDAADAAVADQHDMVRRGWSAANRLARRRFRPRRSSGRRGSSATPAAGRAPTNSSGLSRIEMMAPARIRSRPCSGSSPSANAEAARMKENSPICARLAEIVSAVAMRIAEGAHDGEGRQRLADHDDEHRRQHRQRLAHEDRRVEQHADRDEEQHREGVAQRQRLVGGALAELRFAQDHAGEEGAERERHAEQLGRAEGDAERDRQHRQAEQLARAGMRRRSAGSTGSPGVPTTSMTATKAATLASVSAERPPDAAIAPARARRAGRRRCSMPASAGSSTSASTIARSSTISQPTAMRPRSVSTSRRSCSARSSTTVLATDSARPNTRPAPMRPAEPGRQPDARAASRTAICTMAPGTAIARTDSRSFEREMQADAEHQQDDADLGQLVGELLVGDEARRERPDRRRRRADSRPAAAA